VISSMACSLSAPPPLIASILGLGWGAVWLVESAARIAKRLGLSELVIGLTVVAIGTSAPEFAVTVGAALKGQADIAVGNVVGSNIFNLGFILGGVALVRAIATSRTLVVRDGGVLIGATLLLVLFLRDLTLARWEGLILMILLVAYIGFLIHRREPLEEELSTGEFHWYEIVRLLAGLGLVVVGGWYVSGRLGYIAEDPNTLQEAFVATNTGRMEAFSFVAPLAYSLEYLMFWTDKSRIVTYGIASAAGVIAGSAVYALVSKSFRWEGFRDAEDTGMHLIGGVLMGFGGITALGCTIGQGISGFSTLALGSIMTFLAIVAGAAATMKWQYWRMTREG